ncbi:hypothetical protein BDV98DRAFT_576193 [Pterulicium gracile]|uniref:Uncharacterized protein n=1 Tax=Pterulicium gracile TaxID=1884261 RepID=A0A5C3Q3L8_9AGAR|nr:hypothetical protein BDV98DRAFT_576193 [Pterula gracilis]
MPTRSQRQTTVECIRYMRIFPIHVKDPASTTSKGLVKTHRTSVTESSSLAGKQKQYRRKLDLVNLVSRSSVLGMALTHCAEPGGNERPDTSEHLTSIASTRFQFCAPAFPLQLKASVSAQRN